MISLHSSTLFPSLLLSDDDECPRNTELSTNVDAGQLTVTCSFRELTHTEGGDYKENVFSST